ncbi:MAG: hypothetical protein AB1894_29050 [Chloroflexota bacterium]
MSSSASRFRILVLLSVSLLILAILLLSMMVGFWGLTGQENTSETEVAAAVHATLQARQEATVAAQHTPAQSQPTPQRTPAPVEENGELVMNYPQELRIGQGEVVVVEVRQQQQVASLDPVPHIEASNVDIEVSPDDPARLVVYFPVKVYPVVRAELSAASEVISISGEEDGRRYFYDSDSATWTWDILAKATGRQKLTLRLYGEAEYGGEKLEILVKSLTRNVEVVDRPFSARLADWLGKNLVVILGTGGPLALLLAYLTYKSNQNKKELEQRLAALEKRIASKDED